jgi:hypothetical protein
MIPATPIASKRKEKEKNLDEIWAIKLISGQ